MLRALFLLVAPGPVWTRIATDKPSMPWVCCIQLLPILAISCALEGFLLVRWGEKAEQYDRILYHSSNGALGIAAAHMILGLVMVFGTAFLLRYVGESFHFYPKFETCFTLVSYAYTPYFLLRLLHYVPGLNGWIGPILGAVACAFVLYQGVGAVLEPQQSQGFGLYILAVLVFLLVCALDQVILMMLLQNRAFA